MSWELRRFLSWLRPPARLPKGDAGLLDVPREGGQGVGRGRPAGRENVPWWEIVFSSVLVDSCKHWALESAQRYSSKQRAGRGLPRRLAGMRSEINAMIECAGTLLAHPKIFSFHV